MATPVYVLHLGGPELGPWSVGLGRLGAARATTTLAPEAVSTLQQSIAAAAARPGRVLVPGRDRKQARAEARIGQHLLDALCASDDLVRAMGVLADQFSRGEGGVLLVDAEPRAARALPWELLAHTPDAPPMAFTDRVVVARLTPGSTPARTVTVPPRPALYRLSEGHDAVVEAVEAGFCDAWGEHLATPVGTSPTWLHLIAHGGVDEDGELGLRLAGRDADSTALTDQLAPYLQQAAVTVLAVCHAGGTLSRPLAELPAQLVWSGAPAVVGAADTVSPEALAAFAQGLASAPHASPLDAIAAGWRRVRSAALPWPDARWHRLRVFVPSADGLLSTWTAPGSTTSTYLDLAKAKADVLLSGFYGIEHLLLALVDVEVPKSLAALRYRARLHEDRILARLGALQPHVTAAAPTWTPRIQDLLDRLPGPADLEALWLPLLRSAGPLLAEVLDLPPTPTLPDGSFETVGTALATPSAAATALEVLGGPEDGRRFAPTPGDWIGRPSRSAPSQWNLYDQTPLVDPRVSRQHLQWTAPGKLRCRRPVRLGGTVKTGDVVLLEGQVLQLGGSTWLVGRTAAS